ncbi:DUF72 domain-containing protein [Rhodanobacter sp. Col0626]|uniref:DUF72 domain-containing protein n=1 Tax=Rhodanobacter sp. Col0626 TaxID=3415679 RepID=UPI003CEDFA65
MSINPRLPRAHRAKPVVFVGCAGWAIPALHADRFPSGASHLQRYAQVFNCVEINSSFYRPHLPSTYRRWSDTVPAGFRFAVKMPRTISHQARLSDDEPALQAFLAQVDQLGEKLGCLLLQLPPSLVYAPTVALPFFDTLRRLHSGPVVCEPRHASWFTAQVNRCLDERGIARVAADPARLPRAALPAGDPTLQYLRLHGSPRMYYDSYSDAVLQQVADRLQRTSRRTAQRWCIFDNTANGHAIPNALAVADRVGNGHAS